MTYRRIVTRNGLSGDYTYQQDQLEHLRGLIAGDLRRLETDQRDARHLSEYAVRAGVTLDQARAVLDAFFEGNF
jgi:hypothetical protein